MVGMIIILVLLVFVLWLLISPFIIEVDTRTPGMGFRWISIGSVRIWHDEEWRMTMQIFFYRKTIGFSELKRKPKKIKGAKEKRKPGRRMKAGRVLRKLVRVITTFRVMEWQLAVDTGDNIRNAQLYPLNYLPSAFRHLHINFRDENYLVLKVRNRPWKIIYAFLR